jgi:hypothetical protein
VRELLAQRQQHVLGQHGDAVLAALAVAHQQLAALELDILHAQAQALEQTHARAVEQRGDQPHGAAQLVQQGAHLADREHHRQALPGACGDDFVEPGQLLTQHLAIEEQQRRLRLVLRGGGHVALGREVREEGADLGQLHTSRRSPPRRCAQAEGLRPRTAPRRAARAGNRALTPRAASRFNPDESTRRAQQMNSPRIRTRIDANFGAGERVKAQSR